MGDLAQGKFDHEYHGVWQDGFSQSMPKDAQMMAQILKDMGITEYEPEVINQMLGCLPMCNHNSR